MNENDILDVVFYTEDIDRLQKLIEAGCDVNARDRMKRTPLMNVTIDKKLEMAKLLTKAGADLNLQDSGGWTALHYAAQNNSLEFCMLLLDNKAIVDVKDEHGNTPLSNAVFNSQGTGEVIRLLLSRGADKNLKNNYDVSPLDLANSIANYDVAQFLND